VQLPANHFKRGLAGGRQQIGLWCSPTGAYAAEAVAGSGFDWLLFDTEHSPPCAIHRTGSAAYRV
jgi:4-hydroxy-2-oxoheptanedioate aldolase